MIATALAPPVPETMSDPTSKSVSPAPYGRVSRRAVEKAPPWSRDYLVYRGLWRTLHDLLRQLPAREGCFILDVACGCKPYRSFFAHIPDERYIGLDIQVPSDIPAADRPTLLADAARLPLVPNTFDIVLSTQMLNVTRDPEHILKEIARVMRPGGWLVASGHGLWPVLGDPSLTSLNRWRWTQAGWATLLQRAGLQVAMVAPIGGAAITFGQLTCLFLDRLLPPRTPFHHAVRKASFLALNLASAALDWPTLWTFVEVEGVEPTNNEAERVLRPVVIWRKVSFGTWSDWGCRFVERMASVVVTCRQKGTDVVQALITAIRDWQANPSPAAATL